MTLVRLFPKIRKDDSGAISIEAVLVFPLMFWLMIFGPILFDVVREKTAVIRNLYVIGDIISRQSQFSETEMDFYQDMFVAMHPGSNEAAFRVTQIVGVIDINGDATGEYTSESRGETFDGSPFSDIEDEILAKKPWTEGAEGILFLEAYQRYSSVISYEVGGWNIGWDDEVLKHFLFIRPRYDLQIAFN